MRRLLFQSLLLSSCFLAIQGIVVSSGCGLGGAGGVTYSVKNLVQEPHFFYTIRLPLLGCNDTTLVKYMEKACDRDKGRFKGFSNTYFPNLGYYLTAINGVEETAGKTHWEVIEHTTGEQYHVGHSTYIPQPGDHVAWNLTKLVL